jgi:hypothetical protein
VRFRQSGRSGPLRNRKDSSSRWTRRARTAILLALVLAPPLSLAGFAFAANRLLSGPALRRLINEDPESLTLDYDEAKSGWPGHLRLRNLRIRGSDQNVQWIIRLDTARVDYSVLALLRRTFRAERVLGSGLSFRIRNKLTQPEAKSADASVLPPVPGFADPPLRAPEVQGPAPLRNPWRVDVRGISIGDFDDIWIDAFHFRGAARVDGSFFLRPGLLARIGPARVTVESGRMEIGRAQEDLAVSGTIAAAFAPYEPFRVHGSEVWKTVRGEVRLDARFDRLESFAHLLRRSPGTRLIDGNGTGTIRGTIESGIAKGRVRLAVENGSVHRRDLGLRGDADATLVIRRWNLMSGPLDVSGSTLALKDIRSSGSDDSWRWWGRFEIPSGRIDERTSAKIEARSKDARPLLALFESELPKWTRGLLELEDFDGSARVGLGPSFASVEDLDVNGGNSRIRGRYRREGPSREGVFLIESGTLAVGLELAGEATKLKLLGAKKWFEGEAKTIAGRR